MLESPNNGIDDQLELGRRKSKEGCIKGKLRLKNHTEIALKENLSSLPGKQNSLMAPMSLKNATRCSGNSDMSLLIIDSVGSNTASKMGGMVSSRRSY